MGGSVWVDTHRCVSVTRQEVALKVYTLTRSHTHSLLFQKAHVALCGTYMFTVKLQTCYDCLGLMCVFE